MSGRATTPVGQWLIEECAARDLSWAEASRRASLDKSMISMIVRGQRPSTETCRALAAFFGVSAEHVLRLAGHLGPADPLPVFSPVVRDLAREVEQLPPQAQAYVLDIWRAALRAIKSATQDPPPAADG
jgi:transcriptional regulator with XRE-family HTH domain